MWVHGSAAYHARLRGPAKRRPKTHHQTGPTSPKTTEPPHATTPKSTPEPRDSENDHNDEKKDSPGPNERSTEPPEEPRRTESPKNNTSLISCLFVFRSSCVHMRRPPIGVGRLRSVWLSSRIGISGVATGRRRPAAIGGQSGGRGAKNEPTGKAWSMFFGVCLRCPRWFVPVIGSGTAFAVCGISQAVCAGCERWRVFVGCRVVLADERRGKGARIGFVLLWWR